MTSNELRATLAELGWTQKRLAERLGVDPDTVSRWTNGRTGGTGTGSVPAYVAEYLRVVMLVVRFASNVSEQV
ncbi:putative transcriptional regulator [Burkholderia phage BcepIL02]|uniref:Transcriptional regulator n=1 Tax=Burkholderia phage BcepIL02 TaxID=2886898 RepID=C5IHN0_9CAUD|nr:transcriptional regulator [Burkholderia phage BcepIL02]ACR15031.1 putative transcriptional regulator [Burkholderia phage BcepIL02]